MKYKACIFDFDLTLADSSKGILICFKHTLAAFGYPVPSDEIIYNTIGMTLLDAFDLLTGITPNPEREKMRVEYVRKADEEMVKNTVFYPNAIKILTELRAAGVKTGVCSTKFRYRIKDSFERQAGTMPIDLVIGGEDVTEAKPNPQGLLKCAEGLGVDKREVLYVGDNSIDAETAQRAGVDFAAVLTGSTTREKFTEYPHVYLAESLTDLYENFIY